MNKDFIYLLHQESIKSFFVDFEANDLTTNITIYSTIQTSWIRYYPSEKP